MSWQSLPFSPPVETRVCALSEIPDGGGHEVVFGEGSECFRLLLLRSGEHVWGYHNRCPHNSMPLNYEPDTFHVFDAEVLMCAHHTAMFRITDGECFDGPCAGARLTAVPVEVRGDGTVGIAASSV